MEQTQSIKCWLSEDKDESGALQLGVSRKEGMTFVNYFDFNGAIEVQKIIFENKQYGDGMMMMMGYKEIKPYQAKKIISTMAQSAVNLLKQVTV